MDWVPLRLHSQYSILDSTVSIKDVIEKAKEYNLTSLALTDRHNLFGAVDFHKACKAAKIKAIVGCELWLAHQNRFLKKKVLSKPLATPVILLAKNKIGYKNLCKLSSSAYLEGFYYYPRIDKDLLKQYKEGLVCLIGGVRSSLSDLLRNESEEKMKEEINWFYDLFQDDLYFELQNHAMTDSDIEKDGIKKESWILQRYEEYRKAEQNIYDMLCKYSQKQNIKCVATNEIRYLNKSDWKAHEVLINISSGEPCEIWKTDESGHLKMRVANPKRKICPSHEFYFKSPEEIKNVFQDNLMAVKNTQLVAEKCNFNFDLKTKHYPVFYPPNIDKNLSVDERKKEAANYLLDLCQKNIPTRYNADVLEIVKEKCKVKEPLSLVNDRLKMEFDIISSKGMCDYLLIVYDFISWAKKRDIMVGPGRGSAAGSIICYLIGITDIEPLRFQLFFERFINPERISYPDIDVDICMERRSEVIDYTVNKYGKENVAQIITFGTMKAKMAIRDVGRMLSVPLGKVNNIAKLVPEDPTITLEKALLIDPELKKEYEQDQDTKMIIDMARKIEGSIRNTGIHAAGIIVSANPLTEYIPVCFAKDSEMLVTQFSMKPVESVGMLKIDFLGLKTLTSIEKAKKAVQENYNKNIDWSHLPLNDKIAFDLLNKGKTLGVFQLESGGMQELARQLHIDCFEEIIAVGALYRPGPMDMIPSFINRKHKKEKIEIDHPLMEDILKETYGVMVYQEQVMQIANKLANYSLGEGDVLRKAMGKKDKAEMRRQKEKFINGAKENNIDEEIATRIFDKIEKFASYGFNKSHATAYAYLSYVTAYLKANYPKEWMASLMTSDRDDLTKVSKFIRECANLKISILPPCVNESKNEFTATKNGIRFAMTAIKGVGKKVVEEIVEQRQKGGSYKSLYDFIQRVDLAKVGKKNIETLIDAGAFDFTNWTRDELKASIEEMYTVATKSKKEKEAGVLNLFHMTNENQFLKPPVNVQKLSKYEVLKKEKELLGFYLTSHPLDNFKDILPRLSCMPFSEIKKINSSTICRTAFIIDSLQAKISIRTQKKFAILIVSDGDQRFEVPVWPDLYEKKNHLLDENKLIYAIFVVERKEKNLKIQIKWLEDLTTVNDNVIKDCDHHFEQLKSQIKMYNLRKKIPQISEVKKTNAQEEKVTKVIIDIDANVFSLNNVLELKKMFYENPGHQTIQLNFYSNENLLGKLFIGSDIGIKNSSYLENKIKSLLGVIALKSDS